MKKMGGCGQHRFAYMNNIYTCAICRANLVVAVVTIMEGELL
jgi:hypothetical protein